jgi:hypothetical protein
MTTTQIQKHQLLDYVSKREFNDFVLEMRDFRDITETRFGVIDRRFNDVDRKFDELKEIIRVQTGAILDQFREDLKVGLEYVQNIDNKKVDLIEFEKLKHKVDIILSSKTKEA